MAQGGSLPAIGSIQAAPFIKPALTPSPPAGHTGSITALAMDPWARFVVTGSTDGTARVWDLSSARSIHTLRTGCRPEQGEQPSLHGQRSCCASVCRAALCRAFGAALAAWGHSAASMPDSHPAHPLVCCLFCFTSGGVLCVALSPCTRFAILGCANNTARMYDVISGAPVG